jgi:rhamnosyltransferase subunit B
MHVIMSAVGSGGDVFPYLGIGRELISRGHRATLLTSAYHEPAARAAGIAFVPTSSAEEFVNGLADPDVWHPEKGPTTVMRYMTLEFRPHYDAIVHLNPNPADTFVLVHVISFGGRIAAEKLNVPFATVHPAPIAVRTVHQFPTPRGEMNLAWTPKWFKRFVWWAVDRWMIDPIMAPAVNDLRREAGLPGDVTRVFHDYMHSPLLSIGLFPEWFAPRQPDWPAQFKQTDFPLSDAHAPVPPEVESFLAAGEPPLVFTPGTAMIHSQRFFSAAVDAATLLNKRALLLTKFPDQLPTSLPPTVRHFSYAPFSQMLHRCAALIHHGGIGTTSAALAAGVPQLIMYLSHDQPDNAMRAKRLGVSASLPPNKFTGPRLAAKLRRLLDDPAVNQRCADVARLCRERNGPAEVCDLIERAAGKPTAFVVPPPPLQSAVP